MPLRVALVYNHPGPDRYDEVGESRAIVGVVEAVKAVERALRELGHEVRRQALHPPLEKARECLRGLEADLVFNLFEGFDGRPETEPAVAGMLAEFGFAHTGCPADALALALDKGKAKALLEGGGVKTPRWEVVKPDSLEGFRLGFPCMVKPCGEDASHGVSEDSFVMDHVSLRRQVEKVSRLYGGSALVEEFVGGREFNVTILGNDMPTALPVSEIEYTLPAAMPRILTFAAKWEPQTVYFDNTKAVCPARISEDVKTKVGAVATLAFKTLGCRGYARVDMRAGDDGVLHVLEVNPNPDISPGTGAARQAQAAGMKYKDLVQRIVTLALEGRGGMADIRPMKAKDKPAVMDILRSAPEFLPAEVVVAEEVIDAYLQDPPGSGYNALVAHCGETTAGYVVYGPTPLTDGTWDLYWIAVSGERQGQGIGKALLSLAEKNVRRNRGRLLLVETSSKPGYEKTRGFYASQGYDIACSVSDFYAPGDDKMVYRKRLC